MENFNPSIRTRKSQMIQLQYVSKDQIIILNPIHLEDRMCIKNPVWKKIYMLRHPYDALKVEIIQGFLSNNKRTTFYRPSQGLEQMPEC